MLCLLYTSKSFLKVLEMCRQKGKMGNLLYLNFETVTIFEQYMEGERRQEGLSEIIYYVKQRSSNLGMKVERMAVKGPVEYIDVYKRQASSTKGANHDIIS